MTEGTEPFVLWHSLLRSQRLRDCDAVLELLHDQEHHSLLEWLWLNALLVKDTIELVNRLPLVVHAYHLLSWTKGLTYDRSQPKHPTCS